MLFSCKSENPILQTLNVNNKDTIYIYQQKLEKIIVKTIIEKKRNFLLGYMKVDTLEYGYLFNSYINKFIENKAIIEKKSLWKQKEFNDKTIFYDDTFKGKLKNSSLLKYEFSDIFYIDKKNCFFVMNKFTLGPDFEQKIIFLKKNNHNWSVFKIVDTNTLY